MRSVFRELPDHTYDFYIDDILNSIDSVSNWDKDNTRVVHIKFNSKPKIKIKDEHKFLIKIYRNDTVLREHLETTIEFYGTLYLKNIDTGIVEVTTLPSWTWTPSI